MPLSRRDLLRLGALGAGVGLAGCIDRGASRDELLAPAALQPRQVAPTGRQRAFDLYLNMAMQHVYPDVSVMAWAFAASEDGPFQFPGPVVRADLGDEVIVNFHNLMPMKHTIHWHGVHVPWNMDGVPFVSQEPIDGGQSFEYRFLARPAGTHWYHCHVDAVHHIDMGMYGPLLFDDPEDPWRVGGGTVTKEQVLVLGELDKDHIHSTSQLVDTEHRTVKAPQSGNPMDALDSAQQQARDTLNRPPSPGETDTTAGTNPLQQQRDWYPITFPPYQPSYDTFLLNGKAFPMTEPIHVAEGDVLRLRFIHAGHRPFAMHIHGHTFLVTHRDGHALRTPFWADTLMIGSGERYDCVLHCNNPGVWELHEHSGTTVNDSTFPGGPMTMLVYEGFRAGPGHEGHAGSYLRWYFRR